MSENSDAEEAKLAAQLRLDRICVEFERKLRSGEAPRIEDYLAVEADVDLPELFEQLLTVEWEIRHDGPKPFRVEAALARFPEHKSNVENFFAKLAADDRLQATEAHQIAIDSKPSASSLHGRFEPGQRISGRYRIVSLLGKGGMGEVYRADDLILDQTVALKFLPAELASDPKRLDYLVAEVRHALKVSHPNVCRVHDIGKVEGLHFISMEFIDGENLKSLIERIGRLGNEKGLQIAQQLCLGLAAAHERGVLHHDLKPANVMIDGRGMARITDFGLATVADNNGEQRSFVGTPAYMAPEQLLSGASSVRSDIYSLGLVFYEIFTARKATEAKDALHQHITPSVEDFPGFANDVDPRIRHLIGKCLEQSPDKRPQSAQEVLRALPNRDPIAAALAIGQAPSPEAVASSGGTGALSPWLGLLLFLMTILPLGGAVALSRAIPEQFSKPPAVLREVAETILEHAGLPIRASRFTAHGFRVDQDLVGVVRSGDRHAEEYWYRSSPQPLIPHGTISLGRGHSRIRTLHNPPPLLAGMISLRLSADGKHLRELMMVPDHQLDSSGPSDDTIPRETWTHLFQAAGLEITEFQSIEPQWRRPFPATALAWRQSDRLGSGEPLRIEAASDEGKVVYFQVVWPEGPGATTTIWTLDRYDGSSTWSWQALPYRSAMGETEKSMFANGTLFFLFVIPGFFVAVYQFRKGDCNLGGALKLFSFMLAGHLLVGLLEGDHAASFQNEIILFDEVMHRALIRGIGVSLLYAAIEPLIRRHLPHTMISWNRLLVGNFDAMVARDALIGCTLATWIILVASYVNPPYGFSWIALMGPRQAFAQIPAALTFSLMAGLFLLSVILLVTMMTRRLWIGCILLVAVMLAPLIASERNAELIVVSTVMLSMILFLLVRFGLVACLAFEASTYLLARLPITHDMERWYASTGLVGVLLILACVTALCFRAVTGSQQDSESAPARINSPSM